MGGDSARLLRPIKAQFKAPYFFFSFFFIPALRMPHSNVRSGGLPMCVHGNMIGETRRNGGRNRGVRIFL